MRFSDRLGITQAKSILQLEEMDDHLRNGLWQACIEYYFRLFNRYYSDDTKFKTYMRRMYVDFFKVSADQVPHGHGDGIQSVRSHFFSASWWEVYNLIEFLLQTFESNEFAQRVSFFLEREKSAYRIVNWQLVSITDPVELAAVSEAASKQGLFSGAREHIQSAITLFSRKPEPDFRNCIKEAISAVESVARVITENPKATLGDALKLIGAKMPIHPALRDAMSKLYGYTSDEGGIRHSLLEESNIDEAEAKFMLVACSAFVNFCIQRSA
jgi:AbiJ N-terminal domain 4